MRRPDSNVEMHDRDEAQSLDEGVVPAPEQRVEAKGPLAVRLGPTRGTRRPVHDTHLGVMDRTADGVADAALKSAKL